MANPSEGAAGVAFLGPAGTYTHEAAQLHFGTDTVWRPQVEIRDVFAAVEQGRARFGVVPLENSAEGSVTATLDALAFSPLQICAERLLRIHHCLLVPRGLPGEQVRRILSHPQSLGQCRDYLARAFPQAERVPVSSNAEAARLVALPAARNEGIAAVAGAVAADLYELEILARSIEDTVDNTTRFIVLGTGCVSAPTGRDRTSLLISAPDEPGTLFHALEPFYRHGISLTKLETRPSRKAAWSYSFFVDFEGHVADAAIAATLDALRQLKLEVKWLGSYPQAPTP